ncbi:MAG TPA: GIY-YIG nuclease family protein [Azospira sp.]|nr:GIY-YIG nuclease family protein [Azospira sp.]
MLLRVASPEPPTYQLLIQVAAAIDVSVGRLGLCHFPAGRYVYTGSAKRNIGARVARHLSRKKRLHWHIDYLLMAPGVQVAGTRLFDEPECQINRNMPGVVLVPGFGSTDCRAGCGSHLKYLGA